MSRWMAASLLAIFLAISALNPVQAQANITLTKLVVDLWPEYDRPDMLVIEHLFIDTSTTFPANITVRIPTAVGEPYNVAIRRTDGNLYTLDYNRTEKGDWSEISFSAPSPEIQLEYYDTSLQKNGKERSFKFNWAGGFVINAASIQVQQPSGASNLQSQPASGSPVVGENGLSYYTANLGVLKATDTFSYQLTYQKPDDSLSVQTGQVVPSGAIDSSTAGRFNLNSGWIYGLGGLAILLIAGGGFWYWRSSRKTELAGARRRHTPTPRPTGRRESTRPAASSEAIYCHQCGKRAGPGDVFCRACGTKLKREE